MAIIDQAFGLNWVFYNADCVFGMRELPDDSVDFSVFSPPFLALYIYSDSIADLGNTDSEDQFFDGWHFHLEELYRILKPGKRIAIHCKDTMRYISSHNYAGLYDFPGHIIRLCEDIGFNFERWITIWKDPVVEMQRTKTYGLLHKSFSERGEVTRQGCADYVLVFNKDGSRADDQLSEPNSQVIERMVQQWTNEGEYISTPLMQDIRGRLNQKVKEYQYSFLNLTHYSKSFIKQIEKQTTPGRLVSVHCTSRMMVDIIQQFEDNSGFKFHSRMALTDGSFVITFRNWRGEFENNVVKHSIKPPNVDYQSFERVYSDDTGQQKVETWREAYTTGSERHPDYVGNQPPTNWRDDTYYSILLWQRYASPVWFDLDGLPELHSDCWMDIQQTDVLNYRQARGDEEEKHICPLQLGLVDRLLREYTREGDVVLSPYGGIGSEGYQAIKNYRKAILFELKPNYWKFGCKNLITAENEITQARLV